MRTTDTHIYFFSGGSVFSNFAKTPFKYIKEYNDMFGKYNRNLYFQCSEQAYMFEKCIFSLENDMAESCILTTNPKEVKKIGRSIPNFDTENWNKISFDIMYNVCLAKFTTNSYAKTQLLASGNKVLVEASPYDNIWGCGMSEKDDDILDEVNWPGENRLGKVLMKVRDNIR